MRYAFDGNSVSCCFSVWVDESHFFCFVGKARGSQRGVAGTPCSQPHLINQ